jgi:hypothetical protein
MNTLKLVTAVLVCLVIAGCGGEQGMVFHVSPDGNDTWSGHRAESAGDDGPFATLERARDAVRELKRTDAFPAAGVTIVLGAGTYRCESPLLLGEDDGGTVDAPVVWRAEDGSEVILSGGVVVDNFSPVSDSSILSRLRPEVAEYVRQADLGALNVGDYGTVDPRGNRIEVYWDRKFQTIARWPDEGWLEIADIPQTGERMINSGLDRDKSPVPRGRHYGRFTYPGDRPSDWSDTADAWVHGYWTWDWSDQFLPVALIDTAKREITPAEPHHGYGYTKGQRFYFLNVLEELDTPGEWYLDRGTGILYMYPPSATDTATVPVLNEPMVTVEGARHLRLEGFTFECARAGAVRIDDGTEVVIAGCTFRNLGKTAVIIEGGSENGVLSCDMYDLAGGGIILGGGDLETLTPAANFAENNHIHHFAIRLKTYQPGVQVTGVGNRVRHNLIHDAPHTGIFLVTGQVGNDHLIEFNELHSLAQETGDVGAIYLCARNYTFRGTVIRHNYLHDLHGPGLHGVMGVYLDDFTSGTTIYGNVFLRAGRAAFVGGGRDNTIENNLFIECDPSLHLDARGLGWAAYYFKDNTQTFKDQLAAVRYTEPPYSDRYPGLATIFDSDPAVPRGNVFRRNVSCDGRFFDLYDHLTFDIFTTDDNMTADPALLKWIRPGGNSLETSDRSDTEVREMLEAHGTMIVDDIGCIIPTDGPPRLADDAPAYGMGFEPIPLEKIGLYDDKHRTGTGRTPSAN